MQYVKVLSCVSIHKEYRPLYKVDFVFVLGGHSLHYSLVLSIKHCCSEELDGHLEFDRIPGNSNSAYHFEIFLPHRAAGNELITVQASKHLATCRADLRLCGRGV